MEQPASRLNQDAITPIPELEDGIVEFMPYFRPREQAVIGPAKRFSARFHFAVLKSRLRQKWAIGRPGDSAVVGMLEAKHLVVRNAYEFRAVGMVLELAVENRGKELFPDTGRSGFPLEKAFAQSINRIPYGVQVAYFPRRKKRIQYPTDFRLVECEMLVQTGPVGSAQPDLIPYGYGGQGRIVFKTGNYGLSGDAAVPRTVGTSIAIPLCKPVVQSFPAT